MIDKNNYLVVARLSTNRPAESEEVVNLLKESSLPFLCIPISGVANFEVLINKKKVKTIDLLKQEIAQEKEKRK